MLACKRQALSSALWRETAKETAVTPTTDSTNKADSPTSSKSDDAEIASYLHNKESDDQNYSQNLTSRNWYVFLKMTLDYNWDGNISRGVDVDNDSFESFINANENGTT